MLKQVLFVQGGGKNVHAQWDHKLVASLRRNLGDEYAIRYPEMPDEDSPHFRPWKKALEREFESMRDGDILAGHSIGAAILLHTLVEQMPPFQPGALVLIAAPFIGDDGWPSEEIGARRDFIGLLPAELPVRIYHGTQDSEVPVAHAQLYSRAVPQAIITRIEGAGHQFEDDLSHIASYIRALGQK